MGFQNKTIFERSQEVFDKTELWRNAGGFKHKKPCAEWLKGKRCSHYARARYKHFKQEIESVLSAIDLS